jgi:hypothetical protein
MPVAPNTSSSMIVRTTPPTPGTSRSYSIYNLGQNKILGGESVLPSIGNWNFAGPGAVNWDFDQRTLDVFMSSPSPAPTSGYNDFFVYNRANSLTASPGFFLGSVGTEWQVAGFGYFVRPTFGQADMMMSSGTGSVVTYRPYNTFQNQFVAPQPGQEVGGVVAQVGTDWKTAGFGTFATTDPSNFAGLMFLQQSGTNTVLAYAFRDGKLGMLRARCPTVPARLPILLPRLEKTLSDSAISAASFL